MPSIDFSSLTEGRYDRQELVSWWDQGLLARARFIVAGAGALGNEVLKLLALIGAGHIQVVDFDTVSPSNLARMVLFRESDIGRPKAFAAAERLAEINPQVEVEPLQGDLRFAIGLGDYRRADLVLGCLDSVNARWALNRRCLQAGTAWVDGAISDFHGLVSYYSPQSGACYECTFTPRTFERFNLRYSCPFGLRSGQEDGKVPTTAVTTSLIAALQVQQALLILHHQPEGLQPGERLMVYLKPYQMVKDRLPANPDCLAHDRLPEEIPAAMVSPQFSVQAVIRAAGRFYPRASALRLPSEFITAFTCPACGSRQAVDRLKEQVYQEESRCPVCGGLRMPEVIQSVAADSAYALSPLSRFGIPQRDILAFDQDGDSVFLEMCD